MAPWKRILATVAIGCLGALAQVSAATAAACSNAETPAGDQSAAQVEASVLCLIDHERASAGLSQVRPNTKLRQAAARHSEDMVGKGFFAHTSPGGDSFIDRLTDAGYMRGARSWLVGENLVWGSGDLSTPASLVEAWMQSPPHRANLLRSRFREIGVAAVGGTPFRAGDREGVTVSSEYGYRAVQKKKASGARARARARAARR